MTDLQVVGVVAGSMQEIDTTAPKAKRRSKQPVAPEKSLSVKSLPGWVQGKFVSNLVPTVLDALGTHNNPFVHDSDDGMVLQCVQDAVGLVFPEQAYTADKSCKIFKIVSTIFDSHPLSKSLTFPTLHSLVDTPAHV